MSTPKKKFRDKIPVHSTKLGTQYVRPSDILMNEDAKKEIRLINEAFVKSDKVQSKSNTDESNP